MTVPVTGRSQLQLVADGEEAKMGLDAYQGILKKSKVSADPRLDEQGRPPKATRPFRPSSRPTPPPATRVTQIEGWMPEALKYYQPR